VLRIFLAQADRKVIKYFLAISFMGLAVVPIAGQLTPYTLNNNIFTVTGYVGYFVLGMFLFSVKIRRSLATALMFLGLALTAICTYVLAITIGGSNMYFFQQYFSPTVLLMSVMVFLVILSFKPSNATGMPEQADVHPSKTRRLVQLISENTLPLFLFHVMVLESIENGYLGFTLNRNILNPIIEVPLMTAIVLFVSLAVIVPLKKVPYLKRLIG
jgi:surface polysaccharide O-acyltransferase-like enzyme